MIVDDFKVQVSNQLGMLKSPIVTEIAASDSVLRKWVQISPPDRNRLTCPGSYVVFIFEILQPKILPNDWDFMPEYARGDETHPFGSLDEVKEFLHNSEISLSSFAEPWKTDFPM